MNAMTKIEPTTHERTSTSAAYGQMTIAELLDVHNDLAERCGTDALKSWKRAKPELIDRIEALDVRLPDAHEPEATEDAEPTDHEPDDTPEQPKRTIGALVQELLMDEALGYEAIVDLVKADFSDAKTSVRSVASVAATMRKRGVEVPMRRRAKSAN